MKKLIIYIAFLFIILYELCISFKFGLSYNKIYHLSSKLHSKTNVNHNNGFISEFIDENTSYNTDKYQPKLNDQEWMFFDIAKINVKAGKGGDGCMAMRREYFVEFGGPSGGNGGDGGDILLECDEGLNTLSKLRKKIHYTSEDGKNGHGKSRHGKKGESEIIYVIQYKNYFLKL